MSSDLVRLSIANSMKLASRKMAVKFVSRGERAGRHDPGAARLQDRRRGKARQGGQLTGRQQVAPVVAEVARHHGAAAPRQVLGRGAHHAEGGQDAVDPPGGAPRMVAEHRHAHPRQPQGIVEPRPGLANLRHRPGGPEQGEHEPGS